MNNKEIKINGHRPKIYSDNTTLMPNAEYDKGRDQISQKSKSRDYRYTRMATGIDTKDIKQRTFEDITNDLKRRK